MSIRPAPLYPIIQSASVSPTTLWFGVCEISKPVETDPSRHTDVIHTEMFKGSRLTQLWMREHCADG